MKDVNIVYKSCKQKLAAIGIEVGTVQAIKVNTRSKRWGGCTKLPNGAYDIEISSMLVDDSTDDKAVENTMMHELLHTCKGCMNHGSTWKKLADKVNDVYGYNIRRTSAVEEMGISENIIKEKYKYSIVCKKCGRTSYRMRTGNIIKHPEFYRCKCGGDIEIKY